MVKIHGFNLKKMDAELNVLVMGNNPIELTKIFNNVQHFSGRKVVTEIAFDLKSCKERLVKFRPNYIFIDDDLGSQNLSKMVRFFSLRKNTKNVPITILKNSNYRESFSGRVMNYLLKENLNGEVLRTAISNSLSALRAQLALSNAYQRRKGQLKRFLA